MAANPSLSSLHLRSTVNLGEQSQNYPGASKFHFGRMQCYDVKFYPYTVPGVDAVFAACGANCVIVCRCVDAKDGAIEVLRWFESELTPPSAPSHSNKEQEAPKHYCSVTWAQAANGDPLVCVAGENAQIEVLNVNTQELVQVMIGHGSEVTDLSTSPVDPTIIASCSVDHSIRIWSLESEHRDKPLAAILHGAAHQGSVYSVAFHRKGRYLVSAALDATVCLWAIPDNIKGNAGTDKPITIHYPHFFTAEIHTDGIDCVQWYGDLIFSKAAREGKIILWRIEGFNSDRTQVPAAPIPTSTAVTSTTVVTILANSTTNTRSAWGGRFQRLLQFDVPEIKMTEIYMRFSVFSGEAHRPILAMGNSKSKAFFWDLQTLEDAGVGEQEQEPLQRDTATSLLQLEEEREGSVASATESVKSGGQAENGTKSRSAKHKPRVRGYTGIGNPFRSIVAHRAIDVPNVPEFNFRQFAWSNDGQWCVGVADQGYINIFHRNPPDSSEP